MLAGSRMERMGKIINQLELAQTDSGTDRACGLRFNTVISRLSFTIL